MFAVPPMFDVPPAVVPLAAWTGLVSASALAAMLFGASALNMVAGGITASPSEVSLKASVPPVAMRNVPDAAPIKPTVAAIEVKTSVAALPAPPPAAAQAVLRSAIDPPPAVAPQVDETAAANGFISPPRMTVVSDVTVRTDPRSGSRPLGTLHQGEHVEVAGKQAGWVLVRQGRSLGWVWGEFLAAG
jgi:hypothetical protein